MPVASELHKTKPEGQVLLDRTDSCGKGATQVQLLRADSASFRSAIITPTH